MAERIVINTGPLIALAQADALDIAVRLPFGFVCPEQVKEELDAGAALGHPAVGLEWLEVAPLSSPLHSLAKAAIDPGEAAVIQLAQELGIGIVCLDDWKARRAALAVGLKVVGTLGLLARAKNLGLIPALRPLIQKLNEAGNWYDEELLRKVLGSVDESL